MWVFMMVLSIGLNASSHREAPLISNDPLADNVDVYAFRSPDNPDMITLIATYVPFQLPHGGPNYYTFGENIRYEIHVDNDASVPGDEVTYRFTFNIENEDPTTFFNIRLGKQNQKATYNLERSMDGGQTWDLIVENGIVPPNNIGDRSITSAVGLNSDYETLWTNAITDANTGERVFAGPTDDPFFVDLGGIFDLGDAPRQNGTPTDGVACYNVSALAIQVPISTLLKDGAPSTPSNILDPNYVIGVWASASRPAMTTLSSDSDPTYDGDWVQVSRLGMPLTNEAVIPVGDKDYWNSLTPYDELADTQLDEYFYNPELALYMDDDQFGGAVPAFSPLRIQTNSLGMFDFTNGADGVSALKDTDLTGTAFEAYGDLLLIPGKPRAVDLWPIFHTGVPNAIPYQLATGKDGNPLAAGKPFINNFLPNGGDMLRLNMAVPATPRDDANFSSLGLVQAAAIGLTVAPFNTSADLEFIPNMDGFPNGRRLEDDVTRIELQAVSGVVLAAVGLWYDDYDPMSSPSPVTEDLLGVLTYSTGVEKNDKEFRSTFPYLATPFSGTGGCSGEIYNPTPEQEEVVASVFVSSNTSGKVAALNLDDTQDVMLNTFNSVGMDADGIYYNGENDVLYQLNRSDNVINAYRNVLSSIEEGSQPVISATSTSDFINGREISVRGNKLVVAQDANDANDMTNKFVIYNVSPEEITYEKEYISPINLWGLQIVNDALYAIEDNSNNVVLFENFFDGTDGMTIEASRTISIENLVRTHGIAIDTERDVMVLTDVGEASSATDGAVVIITDFTEAIEDNMVSADEQVRIEGDNTLLGNPVDVAYDYLNQEIYVAERANAGGRILVYDAMTDGGDVAPTYNREFAGASAIYYSDYMEDGFELETIKQFFTSSNTEQFVNIYSIKEDSSIEREFFESQGTDADGIYYDDQLDKLYELDRTNNMINVYGDVESGMYTFLYSSSSDFINGREIAVYGDKLVVAQDANDANDMTNKLVVYTIEDDAVTYDKEFVTDFNLWGIHLERTNLYAVKDNTNELAIISNLFDRSGGQISADRTISFEGLVRTHGITYDVQNDVMVLTDVGEASSPVDGAFIVVEKFNASAVDNVVTLDEQIRVEGESTFLGNPVDIAYDASTNQVFVAERAKDGGRVLGFDVPEESGEIEPFYNVTQPGVSAIYYNDKLADIIVPDINIFDPNFSSDFLISARLSGGAEVPAVTTDAIGVATVTFNDDYSIATVNATVSNLSSDFAGVHIHEGMPGENGPVVFNLTDDYIQGRVQSTFAIEKSDVAKFINGEYYLNVHTANNPNGELRGNLGLEAAESYTVFLEGTEEVPAVETDGLGLAFVHYTSNTNVLEINFLASGLSGNITGIHFHNGVEGENGPVVENLTPFLVGNTVSAKIEAGDYIEMLRNGEIYLNVHTAMNPGGEIRGQVELSEKGLIMDTWLSGSQEAPAVDNNAIGLGGAIIWPNLSEMSVGILIDNLSGPITGAHFHDGDLGESGPVVLGLTDLIEGNLISTNDVVAIDQSFLDMYLAGELYLNVHTESFPAGEVRGQVYRIARDGYAYDLCTDQEVHDVVMADSISGSGMFAFNRDFDEAHMMVVANDLSSEFQGAHIHNGMTGEDGPVVYNLTDMWNNNGMFFYATDEFNAGLATIIQGGEAYVNVHTANNPAGEIRGQIVKEPNCPLVSDVINIGENLVEVNLFPNPMNNVFTLNISGLNEFNTQFNYIITDLTGRSVKTGIVTSGDNLMNVADLENGVFILTFRNDEISHSMKFTKVQ